MTDREKLARQWAEDYQKNWPDLLPETRAAKRAKRAKVAAEYILEHTEPLTMDEYSPVERADMVGMWAGYNRHVAGGKPTDFVIITGEETEAGRVPCYNPGAPTPYAWAPDKWMLTPRFDMPRAWGKDGKPCEPTVSFSENVGVDQPDHPEVLETEEDYESAPEGTVVAYGREEPWMKTEGGWCRGGRDPWSNQSMVHNFLLMPNRRVLRWGDEA